MSNVNAGDLARVVAPFVMEGRGAFVKVLHRCDADVVHLDGREFRSDGNLGWVCEGYVRWQGGVQMGPLVAIDDRCLRRIEPGEGTDEVLLIAQQRSPFPVIDPITEPAPELAR